jgi:hypothetical protein
MRPLLKKRRAHAKPPVDGFFPFRIERRIPIHTAMISAADATSGISIQVSIYEAERCGSAGARVFARDRLQPLVSLCFRRAGVRPLCSG